jgi:hypothetical protein
MPLSPSFERKAYAKANGELPRLPALCYAFGLGASSKPNHFM